MGIPNGVTLAGPDADQWYHSYWVDCPETTTPRFLTLYAFLLTVKHWGWESYEDCFGTAENAACELPQPVAAGNEKRTAAWWTRWTENA